MKKEANLVRFQSGETCRVGVRSAAREMLVFYLVEHLALIQYKQIEFERATPVPEKLVGRTACKIEELTALE